MVCSWFFVENAPFSRMPGSVWLIRLITFHVIKGLSHPVGIQIDNFMKSCTDIYFCTVFERLESGDVVWLSLLQ
jgi:hypothetical protein